MEIDTKEMKELKKLLNQYMVKNMYRSFAMHIRYYTKEDYKKCMFDISNRKQDSGTKAKIINILQALSIYSKGESLGLSEKEVQNMCFTLNCESNKRRLIYSRRPQKETRDNKGIYVGSGGSNHNQIRYPKKNRSKRVWATFYKMFPREAIQDNWNGETSNRMK
jgi:hypothetical protein